MTLATAWACPSSERPRRPSPGQPRAAVRRWQVSYCLRLETVDAIATHSAWRTVLGGGQSTTRSVGRSLCEGVTPTPAVGGGGSTFQGPLSAQGPDWFSSHLPVYSNIFIDSFILWNQSSH